MVAERTQQCRLDPPTFDERLERSYRMGVIALQKLSVGPLSVFGAGLGAVFTIGAFEGRTHLRPGPISFRQVVFVARYAVSQILPSLIWHTQPVNAIAELAKLEITQFYRTEEGLPTHKQLRLTHLRALRGAIAGSVMLAQLLSLTGVIQDAQSEFSRKVYAGKEPPLLNTATQRSEGVVIRLAGSDSDVTAFSMAKRGRRKLWPIFEDPERNIVRSLVETYGNFSSVPFSARVPIFWNVRSGEYGQPMSWRGMSIPSGWLFEIRNGNTIDPLLILEADATPGDGSSLSMAIVDYNEMDFDLHEAAQAFHQISKLAPSIIPSDAMGDEVFGTRVMRVMLVDRSLRVQTGGGGFTTVGEVIEKLRLADVTIDSKHLVSYALKAWLDTTYEMIDRSTEPRASKKRDKRRRFILETSKPEWFRSLKCELAKHGYEAIEMSAAKQDEELPVLVYGKTSADTVYTIRALIETKLVSNPHHVCALLSGYEGLQDLAALKMPEVDHVCSSEIYDAMFEFVRNRALEGRSLPDIQSEVDALCGSS